MKRTYYLLSFLLLFTFNGIMAQNKISGVIKDANNVLAGVNVIEKGMPSNGVITDNVGMFSITLKGTSKTLVVSRVGYATQEVKVSALGKYRIGEFIECSSGKKYSNIKCSKYTSR